MMRAAALGGLFFVLAACSGAGAPTASPAPSAAPSGTASPTATPSATPSSAVTSAPSPGTTVDPNVPIGGDDWGDSAPGEVGERYLFQCPPDGEVRSIWGTDIYTSDSSVCTAAVHSGLITIAEGGNVVIENRPGQESYVGSYRNGVTSSSYPSWVRSFVFAGLSGIATPAPSPGNTGAPDGDMAVLLAHIPAAMNVNCHEVTTLSAGEVIAVSCTPPTVTGYIAYTLFDSEDHVQDKWFGDLDYFAQGVSGSDCLNGPCLVAWERGGFPEGRYFANHYTGIDPNGLIAYWFDSGLMIEAGLVVYDTSFAELRNLALQAGPLP